MSDPYDSFDIENPDLPKAIKKAAMTSGGYPYADKLDDDVYEDELLALQKQLVLLQSHLAKGGDRIVLMGARPGRIVRVVDVPFGRPRDPAEVRSDPRFSQLRETIWEWLRGEVEKQLEEAKVRNG